MHDSTSLVSIEEKMLPRLKKNNFYNSYFLLLLLFGCGGDSPSSKNSNDVESNVTKVSPISDDQTELASEPELYFPKVRVEELDHSQEYFKEQHTTSFSYVSRKNWTSFTASKNGILTKVLLFGKANLVDSPHYGLSMSGFVRSNIPDAGPKYGRWTLTRDDIVRQLAAQGLGEREAGWLTIRMQGDIPQVVGTKYFLVCDKITENKSWFGEFSFAEANPYEFGSHWLNKEHDLVMRTYVGKTDQQIKALQVDVPIEDTNIKKEEQLPVPISQNPQDNIILVPLITPPNVPSYSEIEKDSNRSRKKSMFDRLFKKDSQD